MSGATGISAAVAGASVPKAIRDEGADAVQGFRAALSFESMLLKQMLAEALPESPTGAGEEEGFGGGEGFAHAFAQRLALPRLPPHRNTSWRPA